MKGIVLAGGTGSRLFLLTKVTNKHLVAVGEASMIWRPVRKMKKAGIEEILIVTGTEHMGDAVGCLGAGKGFGCRFTYKVQGKAGPVDEIRPEDDPENHFVVDELASRAHLR
jgi:glucose-1-phosphate thymidylyltransferase